MRNYFEFKSFDQILTPRQIQDMKAFYLDFKNQFKNEERSRQQEEQGFAFDEVVFYIDLLRTDEINLDYIFSLIYDENRLKNLSIDQIKRMIRSSIGLRAKEELIINFIEKEIALKNIKSKEEVITKFYEYAQNIGEKEIQSMINEMKLDSTKSQEVIKAWIVNGNVETLETNFNEILPKVSRIGRKRKTIKDKVIEKANQLVEIFNEIFYK
ncbi:type I restriction endonuclease subunit R, EcoR124 family [Mycoplasmopsis edwardii]